MPWTWRQVLAVVTRLWEMLSDRKHREQELMALFDTASDLTSSLRDTDQLLNRIVQRARERFASDSCYLVLTYPATGEARVRVTAGSVGSSISEAHLPMTWGLVGVMQRSGGLASPRTTSRTPTSYTIPASTPPPSTRASSAWRAHR